MIDVRSKRAQSAAGAAVLLAIIAFFIIMFIILIPPQERAELLGENTSSGSSSTTSSASVQNLLAVTPGRIDYIAQDEIEHPIPVVNIFTRTESKIIAEKNIGTTKKGIFTEQNLDFSFNLADLANTENVLLSFSVNEVKGALMVYLNGEEIYNAVPVSGPVPPIMLPRNFLNEQNVLTFKSASPGAAFWRTNTVAMEGIKVVADVTEVDAQSSTNVFLVSDTEKQNLEKAVLKFQPNCNYGEVGKLNVQINGEEVYNAVPDCDLALIPIDVAAGLLNEGQNKVTFYTDRGNYLLTHVVILSQLRAVDFPTYYFQLSHEQYTDVVDEDKRLRLTLNFVDVVSAKRGQVIYNGHTYHFDTKEDSYTIDLSIDVEQGSNSVKIKPSKTVEIRELDVDLVK